MFTIDRMFCTTFPLASYSALPRLGSDHIPIIWDCGLGKQAKSNNYKMEKWWFLREDFKNVVERIWNAPVLGSNSIEIWQKKIRNLRKTTKGWCANIEADLRKLKKNLMEKYDKLDIKLETSELSDQEKSRMKEIYPELQNHWLKEEVKAKQKSRARDISEGDRNTTYFHAMANQRRRKMFIHSLDGLEGPVTETVDLLKVAGDFYKNLCKAESRKGFSLNQDFFSSEEKVSEAENEICKNHSWRRK